MKKQGIRFSWIVEGEKHEVVADTWIRKRERVYSICVVDEADEKVLDENFVVQDLSLPGFVECIKRVFPKAKSREINKLLKKTRMLPEEVKEDE